MAQITLRNGKAYNFAPLGLTEEAIELVEVFESDDRSPGKVMRTVRVAVIQSLTGGGHSEAEIQEAVAALPLNLIKSESFELVLKAMTGAGDAE